MEFCFLSEADTRPGQTYRHRYQDLIDEVLLAEHVGFDLFAASEQHFAIGGATISAPEVLYPYLMALTTRLRFIHAITLLPKNFNHPLRVAERIATEDILSNGRIQLATGRGNTPLALRAFEVSAEDNKSQWDEGIDLIRAAWLNDPFTFVGKHYKVPPRSLAPKPIQSPHPPLGVGASSPQTHLQAAEKGIGVISFPNYMGMKYLQGNLEAYGNLYDTLEHPFPTTRYKGAIVAGGMYCAETSTEAKKPLPEMMEYAALSVGGYERLAQMSKDYSYMGVVADVDFRDQEYMLHESAGFIVGDPDECIKEVAKYEDLGLDMLIMRCDGVAHDHVMRSLELFGRYVIPHFKTRSNIVRPAAEILDRVRQMRPQHEAAIATFESEVATDDVMEAR